VPLTIPEQRFAALYAVSAQTPEAARAAYRAAFNPKASGGAAAARSRKLLGRDEVRQEIDARFEEARQRAQVVEDNLVDAGVDVARARLALQQRAYLAAIEIMRYAVKKLREKDRYDDKGRLVRPLDSATAKALEVAFKVTGDIGDAAVVLQAPQPTDEQLQDVIQAYEKVADMVREQGVVGKA
jgi:hypothetical protein